MTAPRPERSAPLVVDGITKRWGARVALDAVHLELRPDAYTCIMGPSGSGKSTLLRVIAGHERPDAGTVSIGGQGVTDRPAERRPIHTVFQTPALFPFASVLDNVAFAGRVARLPRASRRARAATLLREVGLDPDRYGERDPSTLSGGEAQRVALARALFGQPDFLLLDEPLTALDRHLRRSLRETLATLQHDRGIGFVHVTHEPEEAMALADALVVLIDGRIAAQGTARALYDAPPGLEVARLLGPLSPIPGGFLRPERLSVRPDAGGRLRVTERRRVFVGDGFELELHTDAHRLLARSHAPTDDPVRSVDWADEDVLCWPA